MDGGATAGGSVAGPAPFLLKTYEMVDDSKTDRIVSWSGNRNSFVVWDPPEFQRLLLPTYFKHSNFSSFIRQLNTYGFRKIDSEKWEFANEEFAKGQKHLLKNIHRRKPIHSHSQTQGSTDPERAAFEEEIDKLTREKSELEGNISRYKQQNSSAKEQLKIITDAVLSMEQRQEKLSVFIEKASQNPKFVERLAQKLESMDFSAYNKKRKLPLPQVDENVLVNSQNSSRSEFGNVFQQETNDKLRLEITASTQNSNEDGIITPEGRIEGLWSKEAQVRTQSFFSPPDTLELSDTGTSLTVNMDRSEILKPLTPDKEGDRHISCILDLTLSSSSPLQLNKNQDSVGIGPNVDEVFQRPTSKEINVVEVPQRPALKEANVDIHEDHHNKKQENNGFWARFLTEMPGSPDNNSEEANSGFRTNHGA